MKKLLIFLILLFSLNINVKAASLCNYQEQIELNQKAASVQMSYEVVEEVEESELYIIETSFFRITILNVTEEVYVVLKNDVDEKSITFNANNAKDGIITYDWTHDETVTNFTLEVYSSNKTNCANELYKTQYMTTPRYNEYYNREICHKYEDFYLCQRYVTRADVSEDEFLQKLRSYEQGTINEEGKEVEEPTNPSITDNIFNFIDKYKWVMLGVLVVAGGCAATTIILVNKKNRKKQRDLGL